MKIKRQGENNTFFENQRIEDIMFNMYLSEKAVDDSHIYKNASKIKIRILSKSYVTTQSQSILNYGLK